MALRAALTQLTADAVDDNLLLFLEDALKGDSGLGVSLPFAEELLASFFTLTPQPPAVRSEGLRGAIAACYSAAAASSAAGAAEPEPHAACARAAGGASAGPSDPLQAALSALFPHLGAEVLLLAAERCGAGAGAERVAAWLLENEAGAVAGAEAAEGRRREAARAAAAQRRAERSAEQAARASVLARFHEVPDTAAAAAAGGGCRPVVPLAEAPCRKGAVVRRYVEGQAVMLKANQRFLVEKPAEPAEGTVVALKIKKKGSGGAPMHLK